MSDTDPVHAMNPGTSNVLDLGPAKLAGLTGEGVVRVRRDMNGAVFEILGTWRLPPHTTLPALLRRAQDEGTAVTYDGPIHDSSEPTSHHINAEVHLDGIHVYQHSALGTVSSVDHGAPMDDVSASSAPVVLVHFALDVKALPYGSAVAEHESPEGLVATHALNSREAVPVLPSARWQDLPPWDATLDGILGGSWQMPDDGTVLWFSTPAESKMAFSALYDKARHLVNSDPVDLAMWPDGTPEASPVPARDDGTDGRGDGDATRTSGSAPRRSAARGVRGRSFKVEIHEVGRSPDANYVVARGTVR